MSTSRSMTIPVEITLTLRGDAPGSDGTAVFSVGGGAVESTLLAEARKAREPAFDAPFDPDYGKRKGFDEKFLGTGENIVPLPVLGPQNEESVARLLTPTTGNKYVLHYENFSVAMNAARRLAFYSAANVSFGQRYEMSRSRDVWRRDPRILAAHQLEGFYYVRNKFDRGHLTRREDLEFGATPQDALASAGDTCHFTNCAPQHERFNQNREIWQGIERYILEESIREGRFNAQIITGPIFDEGDPEYQEIQYPLQFWKVVAGLKPDGKLFASAYLASQDAVIDQYGIEAVGAPLGAYKTFQISIAEIERLTGLSFPCGVGGKKALRDADVLARPASRRRRRAAGRHESSGGAGTASGYHEIRSLEDIAF